MNEIKCDIIYLHHKTADRFYFTLAIGAAPLCIDLKSDEEEICIPSMSSSFNVYRGCFFLLTDLCGSKKRSGFLIRSTLISELVAFVQDLVHFFALFVSRRCDEGSLKYCYKAS